MELEVKRVLFLVCMLALLTVSPVAVSAENDWFNSFYQYRIPVVINCAGPGWNIVPLDQDALTASINMGAEMTYDPLWFAYNHLKVVAVDNGGNAVNQIPDAGFYLVPDGDELFTRELTGKEQSVTIPTEKDAYYLAQYQSEGGGGSPFYTYDQVFPIGVTLRKQAYMSSYEAPLLPLALTGHERLLKSDGEPIKVFVKNRFVPNVKKISVRKVQIVFLAKVDKPGQKQWLLYYQPQSGHFLKVPQLRKQELPAQQAIVNRLGNAQKYTGATLYRISRNKDCAVWFADSIVKVTPDTKVPEKVAAAVKISAAKNEAQSFQLMLTPKKSFKVKGINAGSLVNGKHKIGARNIEFRALEYVNIQQRSYITPVDFSGPIADPLVAVAEKQVAAVTGNIGFWVTVAVPAGTAAGIYKGELVLKCSGADDIKVPLEVEVYDFELPEFASFQSSMGLQYVSKKLAANRLGMMDYHGLKTRKELEQMFRAYCEVMAKNKFYPKTVAMYSEIGMKWSPPPQGYNVDAPDNFFKLYDWDFTEFNQDLKYYIDELKVNSVCLTHTNPKVSNMFKHLPGDELDTFTGLPPHITMAWQFFRDHTYVVWDKQKGDSYYDETIEITVAQFDRLQRDYYRAIAANLEQHGWLDKFYIQIDETDNTKRILHLLRLLKSDPLTAKIKIVACMQSLNYLHYKEKPEDSEYAFNGLLTYMPQDDENYQRWEDYFRTDYDLPQGRRYLWNYAVAGSRLEIDVPGVNNRMIALDIFNRGGSGFLDWEILLWDAGYYTGERTNPWQDPYSIEGNGVLAYFYPPQKNGLPDKPDYTVTPSLRVMTFRESVDDYEYAVMLENLIKQARQRGVDVSDAEAVIKDIDRFFSSSVNWSQNGAWYLELRDRMARTIVKLKQQLEQFRRP